MSPGPRFGAIGLLVASAASFAAPVTEHATANAAPSALVGNAKHALYVTLSWAYSGKRALGFVVELCDADGDGCEPAALIRSDQRQFEYYFMRPHRFRIAAFGDSGRTRWSALTPMLGRNLQSELMPAPVRWELDTSLSAAAKLIESAKQQPNSSCTTPKELALRGDQLFCIQGLNDWYQEPDSCGTGGCIFTRYSTVNSCYSVSDQIFSGPPCYGKDAVGYVYASSSGSAYEGVTTIFFNGEQIDSFNWNALQDIDFNVPVEQSVQSSDFYQE